MMWLLLRCVCYNSRCFTLQGYIVKYLIDLSLTTRICLHQLTYARIHTYEGGWRKALSTLLPWSTTYCACGARRKSPLMALPARCRQVNGYLRLLKPSLFTCFTCELFKFTIVGGLSSKSIKCIMFLFPRNRNTSLLMGT